MKWWPWRRHHDGAGHDRADEALKKTTERREETEQRDRGFLPLADTIRAMREENHLAEAVESALKRGRRQ